MPGKKMMKAKKKVTRPVLPKAKGEGMYKYKKGKKKK